jgi:MFS family permease
MISFAAAAPLRRRDFRLFWLGQWVSQLGDNIFLVAQTWLIWNLTGSGAAMATVALCSQIPSTAMLLVGGALVDRLPRRWVSIASDAARGAILLVLAALYAAGALRPLHLYGMAAVFGLVSAFARPAFGALVQTLIPTEERVAGNALVSAGSTVASIAGPTLGGLIMGLGGAGMAFLLNGISFLVAGAALVLANPEEPDVTGRQGPLKVVTLTRDLRDGLRLITGKPFLLVGMASLSLILITGQAPVVILRPWVAAQAGGGVQTLSLAYTFFAVGMFLTVAVLGALKLQRGRAILSYSGFLLTGLVQVGMAYVAAPWQMWVLDFLCGASVMIHGVMWPAILQDLVPPAAMGRVSAIDQFGSTVLYPLGLSLVGFLSTRAGGPAWALAGGGVLTALVAAVALATPQFRTAK